MREQGQERAEAAWEWGKAPDKWICRTSDTGTLKHWQITCLWSVQYEPVAELKRGGYFS